MSKLLRLLLILLIPLPAAADWFTATIQVTNTAGTTNGQTYTVSGLVANDTRTWTNSVFDDTTQILTNNTQVGAAAAMLIQASENPFAGFQILSAVNGFTIRSNAAFNVTISPGWGLITWSPTNPVTTAIAVDVPLSSYQATQQTNVASGVMAALNDPADTNQLLIARLQPGLAYQTNPVFVGTLSVTNPANGAELVAAGDVVTLGTLSATGTVTALRLNAGSIGVTGTVSAVSFTSSGATNLLGVTRFTNAAGGHFLWQPVAGGITNNDDGEILTNLQDVASFDVPRCEMFTNNLDSLIGATPAGLGIMTNAGPAPVLNHTNGAGTLLTNLFRFRKALPRDWLAGSAIAAGITSVCAGTNDPTATNCVYSFRLASLSAGTDLSNPTWGLPTRTTNGVAMGAWTNGVEAITAAIPIGGTVDSSRLVLWEVQRQSGDGGDTETNFDCFISHLRFFYHSASETNFPASTP